jgi:hypothetical protein
MILGADTWNLIYLEGKDQEDDGSRLAQVKSYWDPNINK